MRLVARKIILSCAILAVLLYPECFSATTEYSLEYKVKAAYVYKILKFVSWPEDHNDSELQVVVCLLGNGNLVNILDPEHGLPHHESNIEIKTIDADHLQTGCAVAVIGTSESWHLKKILDSVNRMNVLTISDIPEFPRRGGIIGFRIESGKVRLEINNGQAKKSGIQLSSKLLEVASVIN